MALYSVTHKRLEPNRIEILGMKYIMVGAYRHKERINSYLYDDQGDNISQKNPYFCELTGIYWLWKQAQDKNIGICHYRRFFTHNPFSSKEKYFYSVDELDKIVNSGKWVVAERLYVYDKNIKDHYARYHYKKDLDTLEEIIKSYFSDYFDSFREAFSKNYFYPCNMMYCSKSEFDAYCLWLFSVLNKFEQNTDVREYNTAQARLYGFIAERLLNVWLIKNKKEIVELPVIQVDSKFKYRVRMQLDKLFKRAIKEDYKYDK